MQGKDRNPGGANVRHGFRSFHLKPARPVRRRGSRLGTGKANEIGLRARTPGPRRAERRPGRRGSRLGAGKANEIGFQARTPGPRRAKSRPVRRRGSVKSSFVCKFNSYIIVLLNLSTMLRAQIAALWQFALALLLCQFPLIF